MDRFNIEDQKIKSGFTTPDNYFDNFQKDLNAKIIEKPVVRLFSKIQIMYAVAAILVIALMIPIYNAIAPAKELDAATIENYLAYDSGLTQFELIQMLNTQDISNIEVESQIQDEAIEDVLSNNPNLEHYLTE